jgi:tetratricopeptide (TPR) repeat protein
MATLGELRSRVLKARAGGGAELAAALLDLAEAEPVLRHRAAPVRALLEEAARVLDTVEDLGLKGRVLLRLAEVKLAEEDQEGAEQLAVRAADFLGKINALDDLVRAGTVQARAEARRGRLDRARALLGQLGAELPAEPEGLSGRRTAVAMALALGEVSLSADDEAEDAEKIYGELLPGVESDPLFTDAAFACHQSLAFLAATRGDVAMIKHLRAVIALARGAAAPEDECEARVAVAAALAERGDLAGREEAERHVQVALDTAIEHSLDSMHMAALTAQAGLMARKGQTQGALDRCLEIARAAVAHKDLPRYVGAVALMSEVYQQQGDYPSAYRALAEADAVLREQVGETAREMVRPHLLALSQKMGRNKFLEMADNVNKAQLARRQTPFDDA